MPAERVLEVGSALPDPRFEVRDSNGAPGDRVASQLDHAHRALAADGALAALDRRWRRASDPHATATLA